MSKEEKYSRVSDHKAYRECPLWDKIGYMPKKYGKSISQMNQEKIQMLDIKLRVPGNDKITYKGKEIIDMDEIKNRVSPHH